MDASNIDEMVNQAVKEVKARVLGVADKIGYDLVEAIQIKYDHCVDAFYKSFTPAYYDRTYNTYSASDGEHGVSSLFDVQDSGDTIYITAGITLDSNRLQPWYDDPTDYVFSRTWERGIHGTIETGGQMGEPPKAMMDKWFKDFQSSGHRIIVNKHLASIGLGSRRR